MSSAQEIRAAFAAAVAEISEIKGASKLVADQLSSGVDIEVGYHIIDRYWEGADAQRLKVRLTTSFPEENGSIIREAPFSEKMGAAMDFTAVRNYFDFVFPGITERVEAKYAAINSRDLNDQEALMVLNEFRKEPVKFLDLIDGMVYNDRERLTKGEYTSWAQVPCDTPRIENGDYLFLFDYRHELNCAKQKAIEDLFGRKNDEIGSLSIVWVGNFADRVLAKVMLASLFFESLEAASE